MESCCLHHLYIVRMYIISLGFGEAKREVEEKEAKEAAIVAATAARQEELRREEAMRREAQNSQSLQAAQLQQQEAERLKKAKKAAAKEAKMMILSFKNADYIHTNITYNHFDFLDRFLVHNHRFVILGVRSDGCWRWTVMSPARRHGWTCWSLWLNFLDLGQAEKERGTWNSNNPDIRFLSIRGGQ